MIELTKKVGGQGVLTRYFDSWVVFFRNFIVLWGIAVIFLVPLGIFQHLTARYVTVPYMQKVEESLFSTNNNGSAPASIIATFVFVQAVNIVVTFLAWIALFIAVSNISKKKEHSVSSVMSQFSDNFKSILSFGWKFFLFIYVFVFAGVVVGKISFSDWITVILTLIGFVIIIIRFHIATIAVPYFVDNNFSVNDVLSKSKNIVKGKWASIAFDIFIAGILTMVILSVAGTGSVFGIMNTPREFMKIAKMQQVSFVFTILPVLVDTLIVPAMVVFVYKLYEKVKA